jgi:hypothetical protein
MYIYFMCQISHTNLNHTQGVSGGIINILEGGNNDYSE